MKFDSSESKRLLQLSEKGDAHAVSVLFSRHAPFLRRVISGRLDPRLGRRLDESDVLQETQLEAVRRIHDYLARQPMPFRLWLYKLACERVLYLQRKHLRYGVRSVEREVWMPPQLSASIARQLRCSRPTPSEKYRRNELARQVRLALGELSERDREIIVMRNVESLSNQEVAQVLQIDPDAASQRYGRAILRLRKLLLERGISENAP